MFSLDWRGLILPIAYMLVLGGTFVTFSSVYRKRKACKSSVNHRSIVNDSACHLREKQSSSATLTKENRQQ